MKYSYWLTFVISFYSFGAKAQSLSENEKQWLAKNAKVICADSTNNPHWEHLIPHVKNKKILLLGEFTHGAKEIFDLRTSLIKFLHEKLGVKAILLESGIGELFLTDLHKEKLSTNEMIYGLTGPWRTKEFAALMDYAKSQKISLAGFDVQRTGSLFGEYLRKISDEVSMDTGIVNNVETRYSALTKELTNRKAVWDSLNERTTALIADYKKLEAAITQKSKLSRSEKLFGARTAYNRAAFLSYMLEFLKTRNFNKRWIARDSLMAENVQWLIDHFYKNERVVVIGHNFHIGKYNEKLNVMGAMLKQKNENQLYALGFFAARGIYHDNFGQPVQLLPTDLNAKDIKHIIAAVAGSASFISVPNKFSEDNSWMNSALIVNDTFIDLSNGNKMDLSKTFDGLLLLKNVSVPTPMN